MSDYSPRWSQISYKKEADGFLARLPSCFNTRTLVLNASAC